MSAEGAAAPHVVEVPVSESTNAELVAALQSGESWPHLGALVTRDQRSGRGRLDREWVAPAGTALAISVVLRVGTVPDERRGWIPLVAGAAMVDAIGAQLPGAGVKWPNDVLVDGRKICGILAQVADFDTIVVGSGVNTRMTAEQLPVETATSFAAQGVVVDEERLIADYLRRLGELVDALGRGSVRDIVAERCVTIGQRVTAHLPGSERITGRAMGLDELGHLLIDGASRPIAVGDIVHLRPA
ncbi:MAG: biotin--[acetyl-CoA-carboxylase] ligase [Microbacterium gubbeenense]|uniref:biotin--[acetyl-CoA-carboxylase] ligase n=1 Tax=Microbacterium gubbeenense TaxID=159896 RepID=UPI003F97B1CA